MLGIVLGLIGLVLAWLGRRRVGLGLVTVALCAYVAVLVLPVDVWVARPLEDRFSRPAAAPPQVTGIIVLGGSMHLDLSEDRGLPTLNAEGERLTEFVALALVHPEARLAFTGGSGSIVDHELSEADVAKAMFDRLGLAGRPITYEARSRNTYENARYLARMVQPQPGETWLLVTSAVHMPRSVGCFRAAGWPVVAWPVAYKTARVSGFDTSLDMPEKLDLLDSAVREWVGLVAYWLMDRTSALYPGP